MPDNRLRFGVLGTGNIARQFTEGVAASQRCVITAVGSRTEQTALAFADAHGIPRRHGAYDALLSDPGIDAVYVSAPNSLHHAWTLKALEAGKHVLCEKPIATTAAEAGQMFDAAQRHGRVLIEAYMYRTHPQTLAVLEAVRRGAIGRVKLIRTSFCYHTRKTEGNIRFSPELAGGALMDIGCYCIDLARLVTGEHPHSCHVVARQHPRGVDEYACGTLAYPDDVQASFCCGMSVQTDNAALICGDEGYLRVPVPWKPPPTGAGYQLHTMTPPKQDGATGLKPGQRVVEVEATGSLYGREADAFAATVQDGAPPFMPAGDSLSNMRVLDELRRQAAETWR